MSVAGDAGVAGDAVDRAERLEPACIEPPLASRTSSSGAPAALSVGSGDSDATDETRVSPLVNILAPLSRGLQRAPWYAARKRPGAAPIPSANLHARPVSDPPAFVAGIPKRASSSQAIKGTSSAATPCIEKTREALRPRAWAADASEAIVAESGYTPPTPTPRKKRVTLRKTKMDERAELSGKAKAEARAPRTESAMVRLSARSRPITSPM